MEGLIGGRRFGSGKRQRWCAACGKGPTGRGETRDSRRADGTVRGSRALRTATDEQSVVRSAARHGSVSGRFSRARGPAQQADAGFDRAKEARSTLPDETFRTGTREPATARGDGTNRPAIRGRGSPHRKVWVSRRRRDSFDLRLARGSVQHFATRTSVRSSWGARATADRRVRARRSKVGSLEECPLTTELVAEIGERHLPNSGIIAAHFNRLCCDARSASQRRASRTRRERSSSTSSCGNGAEGRRVSPAWQPGKLVTERAAAMGERVLQLRCDWPNTLTAPQRLLATGLTTNRRRSEWQVTST